MVRPSRLLFGLAGVLEVGGELVHMPSWWSAMS